MQWLRKRPRTTAAVVGLLLLAGLVLLLRASAEDAQVSRVRELQKQLTGEAAKTMPKEEKQALWRELGKEIKQLTPDQRRALWKDRSSPIEGQIDRFFSLPADKRTAFLDEQINRMEAMRKRWQADGPKKGPGAAGTAGAKRGKRGPSGWRTSDPQERDRRRRQRLDNTTPEQRAKRAEFFKQLSQRRQQRGLPAFTFGRR